MSVVVRREPFTYTKRGEHSFFHDLLVRRSDPGAAARIVRHAMEMGVVARDTDGDAQRALDEAREPGGLLAGLETRAPNLTEGTGGFFTPPLWLNEMFATFPRAHRVLADLVPSFPLPSGVGAVSLPRVTNGRAIASQVPNTPISYRDLTDAQTTSAVVTIAGEGDFAKQLLEQSPAGALLDWAIFKDLAGAYDAELEFQMLFGAGTGVYTDIYLQGATNVAGINKQTFATSTPFYSSSATAANNLNTYMGQAIAQVGDNRKLPPSAVLMTTSRWAWIATSTDNQARPIVPPDVHPPVTTDTGRMDGAAVSTLAGFPVYVDDIIPATFGAGGNQDQIVFCRPSDMILLEGAPQTMVTEEPLAGTLGARLVFRNYVAALTGRYPSSIATVNGTGLVVASGY